MLRCVVGWSAALVLGSACTSPARDRAPSAASATPTAGREPATEPASAPLPAVVSPQTSAATQTADVAPVVRRIRRFSAGGGWEPKSAWSELARVLPEVDRCAAAQPKPLDVDIELRLTAGVEKPALSLRAPAEARSCIERALAPFVAPAIVSPGGSPTLVAGFGYYASVDAAPPLPEPDAEEDVSTLPDGSCVGTTRVDCPPRKICEAPRVRPVRCRE